MIRALRNLKTNPGIFLLFEVPFRIILIFFLTEVAGRIIDVLLRFQGYSYVTQGNYLSFLRNPTAVIGLLLMGLLLLLMILYESCGLFLLFDAGKQNQKISLALLLELTLRQTFSFIRKYPLRWILYTVICLPNLYLHLLIWEIDRARFVDIVAGDLVEKIGIVSFVLILAFYLLVSINFSLSLPYRIFGKELPERLLRGRFTEKKRTPLRNILKSMFLHLRVALVTGAILMTAVVICVLCIREFRPVNRYVSDALFYGSIFKQVLGLLIGFFGTVTITGYLYEMFRETEESCICWEDTEPVSRKRLILCLVLTITTAILAFEKIRFIPDTSAAQDYLEITAHRGGAKYAPENTLAAIQYSIDTKSDYAEIDVQETKDGEIVLLHDSWLGRTTGEKKYIWDMTLEEVQELDAGSHFSRSFEGETIPTLREVIEACRGKLRLNIELKANGHNQDIVQKVLDIIYEENFQSNCIITSMDYSYLKEIKELSPEIVTGYTLSMVYGRVEDMDAADIYSVKYTYVNSRLTARIHEMGKQICAWTTNSRSSIRKAIDAGVDNVITDNPELVRKELVGDYDVIPSFSSLVRYMLQ